MDQELYAFLEGHEMLRSEGEIGLWMEFFQARKAREAARLADAADTLNFGGAVAVQNHDGNALDWNWSKACVNLCVHFGKRVKNLPREMLIEMHDGMLYGESTGLAKTEGYDDTIRLLRTFISEN